MIYREIEQNYDKYYRSIGFERIGLFECIKKEFNPKTVLYLGSSIHISPSFVFQNVTYVDKDRFVKTFFEDTKTIVQFVEKQKNYKQNPYINYINIDYTKNNKLISKNYDLILSIYSMNRIDSVIEYIKKNSIIVFLSLSDDPGLNMKNTSIKFIGCIQLKKNKYCFLEKNDKPEKIKKQNIISGNQYNDKNIYQLFRS